MRKTIISYLKRILRIDISRKMSEEEKVIKNLNIYFRQRNGRIIAFSLLLFMMVSTSIYTLWREDKLNKMMAPSQIGKMATFENPKHELPVLLSHFYIIAGTKAKLIVYEIYFALFTGFFIFMLISELAGLTRNKHKLTLYMFQAIKQLENEVKELKAHTASNDQKVDDFDRENTSE